MIYLDNAATTRMDPRVLEAMLPYLSEDYGNPSSMNTLGIKARAAVEKARSQVAQFFGSRQGDVIFTSGGSEGNNMVFSGLCEHLKENGRTHIIVSAIEHDSVLNAAEALTKLGFHITYIQPSADGTVPVDAVKSAITETTGLVSVMFANNETGAVNEVAKIGEFCRASGVLYHCDCVQAAGQHSLDVERNSIDFATISAHKIHGPKGVGALYARDLSVLSPIIHGGAHQEFGLRGGTENVPGIVGLGSACQLAEEEMAQHIVKVTTLKQAFVRDLIAALPESNLEQAGIHINCQSHLIPGKVLSLTVDDVFGETMVLFMDCVGVCLSAGSACNAQEAKPSHVLMAIGLDETQARQSVRLSFSKFNTEEEVAEVARLMAEHLPKMRAFRGDPDEENGEPNE